ncbi:hypothetical protein ACYSNR_02370 [Enterococcus sp. LJL128]
MKNFRAWVHTAAVLPDYVSCLSELSCPSCEGRTLDYLYVGDQKSRIGYSLVWCSSCNKGIQISRLLIPEEIPLDKIVYFDDPKGDSKISSAVPHFKRVHP